MSKEIFKERNMDEDTRILAEKYQVREGYDTLVESWVWDGLHGKSLILLTSQVENLSDMQIEAQARQWLELSVSAKTTLKRGEQFVYFNFDFKS